MSDFIHLHVHSHYSLLDGLSKVDELIAKAKEFKMPALALTDHGVMHGAIEFYQAATKAGIKPIIGVEAYVARNGHTQKRARIDERPYHLVLLAKNLQGYKNLVRLTTIAHLEGYYYKPRIDLALLEQYHEGIIGLSACLQGMIAQPIIAGDIAQAERHARELERILGKGNFFLEVQDNPSIELQKEVNEKIFDLSAQLDIPVVATNDVHYTNREDDQYQDILLCIQTKKKQGDPDRMTMMGEDFSFCSGDQMVAAFSDHPEVISNTKKIADLCNLKLPLGEVQLPYFSVPEGKTPNSYLRELCLEGIPKRYPNRINDAEVLDRLEYELNVIEKTGFASYFLIVQDFVNWAKQNGIVVGPGRGSAAGSIVAYLTNITNIDPLKYDLLFERFLNPERISMPDIDLDFADARRDEVIRYVEKKYGKDHVSQIITFGTMAARAAVRDAGRVLDIPYSYCDKIAKLIPMFSTIDQALEQVPEFKELYTQDPDAQKVISAARKLEGVARHASTHACGVVITKEALDNYVPVQYPPNQAEEAIITQYDLYAVEALGLLKMDFLGLKNLTILENTIDIIRKARGQEMSIDSLPLEDKVTFKILQRGETTGVFQLESAGMKRYLKQLKPTEFEDIIAMVALYRPGPMELIPDFIDGKHGRKQLTYLHPKLQPILEKTYGIAVYQEQVMQIARDLAGFTLAEADVLRKAVGKKIKALLDEQRDKMIQGMIKNEIPRSTAEHIWQFIEPFARYGFNRAHAACYALIAYQTAYFKAHYPDEFMASLLTSDYGDVDRIAIEVEECERMGIKVLPPDINESYSTFTAVFDPKTKKPEKKIRFGLLAIKNVGFNVVKTIIKERKDNGNYRNLEDFLTRVQTKDLNKKSLESLIKSGALGSFGEQNQLLHNLESLLLMARSAESEANNSQINLFGTLPTQHAPQLRLKPTPAATKQQRLAWEKELLGLYISEHPLAEYTDQIKAQATPINEALATRNKRITVAGVITSIQKKITRANQAMLFAKLEDMSGRIEVLVFPSVLQARPALWVEDARVLVSGKISDKDGVPKMLADEARTLELVEHSPVLGTSHIAATPDATGGIIYLTIPPTTSREAFEALKLTFGNFPGSYHIHLRMTVNNQPKKIVTSARVSKDAIAPISELIGAENIIVTEQQ
ncbi:MAG: DNA polymerase III subunit alpha [Candidatus Kerfeldbacteria bacterium]|nr:DNA polymerase III subunit alpha [Candidatus Kerfeldbacteria bacterium]